MTGLGEKVSTSTITPNTPDSTTTPSSWGFVSLFKNISDYRKKLNLPNPGTFENLHREVKATFLTNHLFDGARVDLTKVLSQNMQVTHSFSMGSTVTPPLYNFGAAFIGAKSFLHGTIDTDGSLTARMNYAWNANNVTKIQAHVFNITSDKKTKSRDNLLFYHRTYTTSLIAANRLFENKIFYLSSKRCGSKIEFSTLENKFEQLATALDGCWTKRVSPTPGHSMLQLEQDYQGSDYSVNCKTINPSPVEQTGIFVMSYFQSVTQKLAMGVETVYQKPTPDIEETSKSLVLKYSGNDYVTTVQWQEVGALQASYYQKINEKVDFGTELQIILAAGRREAGGKFDFRAATFRGQVDTTGRVSAVIEQKIVPGFSFLVTGDIEHMKNTSKFGVGFQLEQ
ncbi:17817_t:CDS:2 [Entrophospora sp. SA101]|nr:17817_t:CDS:2 [Entrophospora sp. SA101]